MYYFLYEKFILKTTKMSLENDLTKISQSMGKKLHESNLVPNEALNNTLSKIYADEKLVLSYELE